MSQVVEITVVCDSPRHARGKIAKVAVYQSFPDGWQRMSTQRRPSRATQAAAARRRKKAHLVDNPSAADLMAGFADPRHVAPRCKLCDAELKPLVVNWLESVGLEQLARESKQQVSITELDEIRFGRKRQ